MLPDAQHTHNSGGDNPDYYYRGPAAWIVALHPDYGLVKPIISHAKIKHVAFCKLAEVPFPCLVVIYLARKGKAVAVDRYFERLFFITRIFSCSICTDVIF